MKKSRREFREKLIRLQENKCFFCFVEMLPAEADDPKSASLYNLDSKYAPWKGKLSWNLRHVAAHRDCAKRMAEWRTQNIPIDELHRRSGRDSAEEGEETYFVPGAKRQVPA